MSKDILIESLQYYNQEHLEKINILNNWLNLDDSQIKPVQELFKHLLSDDKINMSKISVEMGKSFLNIIFKITRETSSIHGAY